MKKYYRVFAILIALVLFNCEHDDSSDLKNYVGFEQGPIAFTVDQGATQTFDVKVAASETSSSDRSFTVVVDDASTLASPYTVPSTVTIPGGSNVGTLTVTVTDNDDLGFVNQTLVLDFLDEAGMDFGNAVTLNFTETCLDTLVTLLLTTDDWPDETTWEIYDLSGTPTVIYSGGPYNNPADDFTDFTYDFCLPAGNYGVVVYDSYGDGGSTYSVTSGGATLVAETTLAGFNSSAQFTVN
ncbi:hypothetical protein [Winogradskyella pulchriflava]|uniref:Calx-beta domain-containing protein n=1 Tax=Winogradskyella pulchriflava TaxID=1110688 RepID=A0ABV6Q4S7_9FLAO